MATAAGDFRKVACVMTIWAAILFPFLCGAVTGRMSTLFSSWHENLLL